MPAAKFREHAILAAILRRQVFVDELEKAEAEYELADADRQCRHVFIKSTEEHTTLHALLPFELEVF